VQVREWTPYCRLRTKILQSRPYRRRHAKVHEGPITWIAAEESGRKVFAKGMAMLTKSRCRAHWVQCAICVDVMNSWICDTSVAFGAFWSILEHWSIRVFLEHWRGGALERFSSVGALQRWSVAALERWRGGGVLEHLSIFAALEHWWSIFGVFVEKNWSGLASRVRVGLLCFEPSTRVQVQDF
jgi:hypothetical protein